MKEDNLNPTKDNSDPHKVNWGFILNNKGFAGEGEGEGEGEGATGCSGGATSAGAKGFSSIGCEPTGNPSLVHLPSS